ncbi:MAG: hypothetical protein HOQ28_06425 [Thermoleophilia bacterium]|nr:hypothetical protein [Thermoleophilia bacterium]
MSLLEASCAATAEALSDRLEGELHGLQRLRIDRHLARCSICRSTLASLTRLVHVLRTLGDAEAPTAVSRVD